MGATFDPSRFLEEIRQHVVAEDATPINKLLLKLVVNTINPAMAVGKLGELFVNSGRRDRTILACRTLELAADYPIAHRQLAIFVHDLVNLHPQAGPYFEEVAERYVNLLSTDVQAEPSGKRVTRWLAINAFMASLLELGFHDGGYCIIGRKRTLRILSEALETDPVQEHTVTAAAQYFIHAPRMILSACRDELGETEGLASPTGSWGVRGSHWNGTPGYSMSRWSFWRDAFRSIHYARRQPRMVRKYVKLAAGAMNLELSLSTS